MDKFNEQISDLLKKVGNVITLEGRSGRELQVNVSKEACNSVNFFFLERVSTIRGEATGSCCSFRDNK